MATPTASRVLLHTRLRPKHKPLKPVTTRLSVLDSIAAPFPPTNGLWIYDRPKTAQQKKALSVSHLLESFRTTLERYPLWAGQLRPTPFEYQGDSRKRFGRLLVEYGHSSDPGLELLVKEDNRRLADFVPSPADRASTVRAWNAADFPQNELMPTGPTAMYDGKTFDGLPVSSLQLTSFACGGIGIAFRVVHALADATSMMLFMRAWADTNRTMGEPGALPAPDPLFDPSLVEKATGGNLADRDIDQALVKVSRSLPIHRFDRWFSPENQPSLFAGAMDITKPPGAEINQSELSPAKPVPWKECDFQSTASNIHLHFSGAELHNLWKEAKATSKGSVSHLDALLAHLWQRLTIAREPDDSEDIYLNSVLGVRKRLSPPLPDNFMGSPTMHVHTAMKPSEIALQPVGTIADAIRATTSRFDQESLKALLHDFTYEAGTQRLWQFFLGERHTTVTTWLKLGAPSLEFAEGCTARHVHFLLPNIMDGVVKIMEAPPIEQPDIESRTAGTASKKHWTADGVIVAMVMNVKVMERLLADPQLRGHSAEADFSDGYDTDSGKSSAAAA